MTPGEFDGRLAQKKEALVGLREQAAAGRAPGLCEFVTSVELLEQDIKDAEALADVRTLDDSGVSWESSWFSVHDVRTYTCVLSTETEDFFKGATPDEARAKAAAWVRGLK